MPTSVAIAVASSWAAEYIAATAVLEWGLGSFAAAALEMGTSFIVGSALRGALGSGAEDSPTASPSFTAQAESRTHVIRSSVANRQVIYGRAKVSGPIVFAASANNNNNIHLVIVLAGHECDAVEEIWLGDELVGPRDINGHVTSGTFYNHVQIVEHLGATDQTADAELVALGAGWTSAHRLRGCTYLHVHLNYSRDIFPRGIPNISAVVRGKKLFDPRDDSTAWSQNPALAVRDYLASDYGLSAEDSEIDDTALAAAANICDEAVTLAAGGTEARYTCNGVLDLGATPRANMEALLSGMAGALTWPAGLWTLHAGAYETPAVSFDEDDLAGPLQVRARVPRQDLYNAIKGTFVDPEQGWQPTDFPAIANSTYATQDGATIFRDVAFPVTTSSATAQRLAKMIVEKSRQGITVTAAFKLTAFQVSAWDNVTLSIDAMGWTDKVFKVTGWKFNEAGSIDLTLQEEAAACYTWSAEETIADPAPDTDLPVWTSVEAPESLTLSSGSADLLLNGDGTIESRIKVAWTASANAFVVGSELQFKPSAASDWVTASTPSADAALAYISGVADAVAYDVRLRFVSALGVRSEWTQAAAHTVIGKTALPPVVTRFSVVEQPNGGRQFFWDMTDPPLDLMSWIVRWSPGTTRRSWAQMAPLFAAGRDARQFSTQDPVGDGEYVLAIKAVDTTGNQSPAALYADALFDAGSLGTLADSEFSHQADWPGTLTDCIVDAGALVGLGTLTWNDLATTSWNDLALTPWSNTDGPIVYETEVLDAGTLASHAYRVGSVEAGATACEVRTSADNVTWTAYAATSTTPISARYFQFRFTTTGDGAVLYRAQSLVYA